MRLAVLVILAGLLAIARTASADPLDPKAVPEPLRPWIGWSLDGADAALCASFLAHKDIADRCAWPSRLELVLDDRGGRFTQRWHLDTKQSVPLPGDPRRWPLDVKRDGTRALVTSESGAPALELAPGDHTVSGSFLWDSLPDSLRVPPQSGLLVLRVRGAVVPWPNRDAQGTVWLQKTASTEEGDALEFVVHRKITDDIPLVLTTRVELHVAGKNREELLGRALPEGFVPMSLDSPLPARLEPDGRLRVQLRPGIFTLTLAARSTGPVRTLRRPAPDGPWRPGDEVWVFEARNDLRMVTVEGVSSIDPQQTTLPDEWKRFPAFPMSVGATLTLDEKRRGDSDVPPDQLTLDRTLWLDFDGAGYTVSDKITGDIHRESRLTMPPPSVLGRVAIDGRDQFITHLDGAEPGIEVRKGGLTLSADSRILGSSSNVPAVGWGSDFRQVSGTLNLPPGWRLVHAWGVDEVPGTWLREWSLLKLFVALVITMAIVRLYGRAWGAIALVMLVLLFPEDDAPVWSWLVVLAAEALFRVLPPGRMKALLDGTRHAAVVVVAIIALPFVIQNVRQGLYPALESEFAVESGSDEPAARQEQELDERSGGGAAHAKDKGNDGVFAKKAATVPVLGGAAAPEGAEAPPPVEVPAPAPPQRPSSVVSDLSAPGSSGYSYRQSNRQAYDPNVVVQTGPGLPHWRWTTLALRWSGPVAASQRLQLFLLSPAANLFLALLRAALLVVVILRLLPWTHRLVARGWLVALVALLLAWPATVRADLPSPELLHDLAQRLTRKPGCIPDCATSGRLQLELKGPSLRVRFEVDATASTAVPLPSAGTDWSPAEVLVDGHPAKGLAREQGLLWVEVAAGPHQVSVDGVLPSRPTLSLSLPMKSHRVDVASSGWTVSGVHEDGLADDDLELTRDADGGAGTMDPGVLPAFVRVERTLHAGLDWQVETRVARLTPPGSAVVLKVPLLAGESVTTADVRVEAGNALVNLGPQATEAAWHSVLAEKSPVHLVAPASSSWTEVWIVDVDPIWHATFTGIPAVHGPSGQAPEWRPWPGEELSVALVRPEGVPGQTLTIDSSSVAFSPGLRATDVALTLHVRSSRGGDHALTLPEDAQLESVSINGAAQPIRQQGPKVTLPVVPGPQEWSLTFREPRGIGALFRTPAIDLGAPSVNAGLTIDVSSSRWLLLVGGSRVGPAVLFWSTLLVLFVVAWILEKNRWTPLRAWEWMLLFVGLSQVDVVAGAAFVGWLLALGWRKHARTSGLRNLAFDAMQLALVVWTVTAFGILFAALYQGLLGAPDMQVRGNGSSASNLRWFVDRAGPALPSAWVVSAPILVYRVVMLAWALWIALALLGWLRWAWDAFSTGGIWQAMRRKPAPLPPPVVDAPPPSPPDDPG
jgi:hypothetical protein